MELVKHLYNNAYKKFTPEFLSEHNLPKIKAYMEENRESLVDYYNKYMGQFDLEYEILGKDCLEIGSGIGSFSFFLESKFNSVTSLDFSELAMANAKSIKKLLGSSVDFRLADCRNFNLDMEFEYIFDSHLLHCLTSSRDRTCYFDNVKRHMAPNGRFFLETMVLDKNIDIPLEFYLDENFVLWQGELPIRRLNSSVQIEREVLDAGFKIDYFYYHNELSFNPYGDDYKIDHIYMPKTLRICLRNES